MSTQEPLWTLEELGAKVSLALSVGYEGQTSGRVRDVPDPRTIRYYTTLGLIDRPAEMRGRTALYGRRHLLQLVAVKRLQARGLSLGEVQEQLLGLSPRALERLAGIPAILAEDREAERPSKEIQAGARKSSAAPVTTVHRATAAFWREGPSPISSETKPAAATPLQLVDLHQGVSLLFRLERAASPEDVEAIRAAAAPLLKLLAARGLTLGDDERNP